MDKYDEYKFFTERVEHSSGRRQNTSQIYLTINTAIFGIVALLLKDSGLHGWNLAIATLPLFAVGVLACFIWRRILLEFKKIIGWHYDQLREMEKHIEGSYHLQTKEWEKFFKPVKGKKEFSFSDLEAGMPSIFIGIYILYAVGMIYAVAIGLI